MKRMLLALALVSCVNVAQEFKCTPGNDAACVDQNGTQGRCEASGNCSFPDASCGTQGFRYSEFAASGRGGVCVIPGTTATTVPAQPIGASRSVAFEIEAPTMEPFVFDTETQGTDTHVTLHWFVGSCPPSGSEQATMSVPCTASQVATRIGATAPMPGPYCLAAIADTSSGHVALRVFPQGNAPSCVAVR